MGVALLALATLALADASPAAAGWIGASSGAGTSVTSSPDAAAATQTVVVLPGQTLLEGSGISGTPTTQTAGVPFTADVYAVDDSFTIDTAATGTLSVVTADPNDVEPPPQELLSGHAALTITPVTANTTGWTITPVDGPGTSVVSAPYPVVAAPATRTIVVLPGQTLTEGAGISGSPTAQVVGVSFTADIYAVDDYFNVDTTAGGTISVVTTDPYDLEPTPRDLLGGHAAFTITPATPTAAGWTITPSGGPGANATSEPYSVLENPLMGTALYIYPLTQTVMAGSNFQVDVIVTNVTNLGAFEFTLAFDPALIQLVDISEGPFLSSTTREVWCMEPLLTEGSVQYTCVSFKEPPAPPGASGAGVLAVAQFSAVHSGVSILDLRDIILLEPDTTHIPVDQVIDGSVTVAVAPTPTPTPVLTPTPTPTLEPGVTPTVTLTPSITPTPSATPTRTPTPTPTPPPPPTTVRVDPVVQTVSAGDQFSVDVWVDEVSNLGAYEFTLYFDPAVLSFVNVEDGPFLSSTTRNVWCMEPLLAEDSVRFACVSFKEPPAPPGASGSGILATVTLQAIGAGTSVLDLHGVRLLNPDGTTIEVDFVIDGSVTAVPPSPTPTFTPTLSPTATPTLEPGITPTITNTPTVSPTPTVTSTPTVSPTPTATPRPITVRIDPVTQNVPVTWQFTVDVWVDEVSNLGAYEFTLYFDPAVLSFVNVEDGPFLSSTTRNVWCMEPLLTEDSVRFACVSFKEPPAPPGASGSGILATVTFQAVNAGTSVLDLHGVRLLNPDGTAIDVAFVIDGSVTGMAGPTPTLTASPTPTPFLSPTPTPTLPPGVTPTATSTPAVTPTPTATLEPGVTPTVTPVPAIVAVDPPSQSVPAGQQFTVDVTVAEVAHLGLYDWQLEFDPLVIEFVDVVNGDFLGSTGRDVWCASPHMVKGNEAGGRLPANCEDGQDNDGDTLIDDDDPECWIFYGVSFGCLTYESDNPGPDGSGILSTVTLNALAEGTSGLQFTKAELADDAFDPNDIYTISQDGSVTVTSGTGAALGGSASTSGVTGGSAASAPQRPSLSSRSETVASGHGRLFMRIVATMVMAIAVVTGVLALAPFAYAALLRWAYALRRSGVQGLRLHGLRLAADGGLGDLLLGASRRLETCLALLNPGRPGWAPSARLSAARLGAGGLSLGLLALGATLLAQGGAAMEPLAADGAVSVVKEPATASLFIGAGEVTIAEQVTDVPEPGLGGFELVILYDDSVIDLAIQEGPFLGSTGRPTICSTLFLENQVRLLCNSSGPQPGPTGSGTLANLVVWPDPNLQIRPTANNGVVTLLNDLSAETRLADPLGDGIPVSSVGDTFLIIQALEGDFNKDCIINIFDEQDIALRYHAFFGTLLYDLFYDVEPMEGDLDIDIKDLQFVFGRHGWICPSITPTPTPTPTLSPTVVSTPTKTPTPTNTPIATATSTPVVSPTRTPTASPTVMPTGTRTATPIVTDTPTPTVTPTPFGTPTVTATPTGVVAPTMTVVAAAVRTETPTPEGVPSIVPTEIPTETAAPAPSFTPTVVSGIAPAERTPVVPERLPPTGAGRPIEPTPWSMWLLAALGLIALAIVGRRAVVTLLGRGARNSAMRDISAGQTAWKRKNRRD